MTLNPLAKPDDTRSMHLSRMFLTSVYELPRRFCVMEVTHWITFGLVVWHKILFIHRQYKRQM